MNIIDRSTHPDSLYSGIEIIVQDRNKIKFTYCNIKRVVVSDLGLMEILFNNGDSLIRNIHRNITYSINLTKRDTDEQD